MVRAAVAKPRPTAVRFLAGDATALPFPDACFGFITILNGFIFPAEVARVLAPRGWLLIAYSSGEDTPIYVPADEIERLCASVGLVEVAHGRAEPGTWTTARRPA
jgi:ubiquinone/menaquinone biosynthesis C-methylase UbiE